MQNPLKKIDIFTKNIIIVFVGTSLLNFFSLLYQLLIAHNLSASDFAAFSTLLSIFMVLSSPCVMLQLTLAKYCAEFNAQNQINKVKFLLSDLSRKTSILAVASLLILGLISRYIMNMLKIPSVLSGYILAMLTASYCLVPVFFGGVQGLEFFWWFSSGSAINGVLKLGLAFIFIVMGFNIAGAIGALLLANLINIVIFYFPLRHFISAEGAGEDIGPNIDYREIFLYLFPLAVSYSCFIILATFDMVLVRYFFLPQDSGLYSLGQMVGKIFLFLPIAIGTVMFPKTSGLKAKNMDTIPTLQKALLYTAILGVIAVLTYNLFPVFILKLLTGKVFWESIILGRLFSISMSFFALLFILIYYFLSINDLRFVKYLVLFTSLQLLAIILFHGSLIQVQLIICANAVLLFFIHLILAYKRS